MQQIESILKKQRNFFNKGNTKEIAFRIKHLKRLEEVIRSNEKEILEALKKDLNKAPLEAYATEIGIVLEELRFTIKHLRGWATPKRVRTSLVNFISTSRIYPEPYGIALIISPWNYPFQLALAPLIGAIAAGNCAVVKPSNESVNTSLVIEKLLKQAFDQDYVAVIQGGREANQSLLSQKFDYIFFTGSVAVGKVVMSAAANNLTPVTLELGGKSPCIVDETADLDIAARRIIWGKYVNAGQTCVAPDYLLVHQSVKAALLEKMKQYIHRFYENNDNYKEFPRVISEKHFKRLEGLIAGEKIIIGGKLNLASKLITPTILDQITWESRIMQEEIFGPVLPVLEFKSLQEVVNKLNTLPKPLAFYYFTKSKNRQKAMLKNVSFGGGCINDTIMHLVSMYSPFGGVGDSGMGGYHGKASFDTFSHHKSVLKKSIHFDMPLRYPPYKNHLKYVKMFLK
ncbi:MAG: NAD-dependent aldehyde dehydrogenase [Herbinix sp.]|jgi:aldehyde dehydrogenase (NAD+)|nr:NAD-dependent aldehyde dehydrogenase [Herbinix sp.]